MIGAIGRAEREVPILYLYVCHHICHLISSPPAQTWQHKKKKKRGEKLTSKFEYISSPYYHTISHLESCSNFHVRSISERGKKTSLIGDSLYSAPEVESRFGIGFRVPCSECRCARLQSLMSQKGKYIGGRYLIHVLRCTGSGQLVSAPRPRC